MAFSRTLAALLCTGAAACSAPAFAEVDARAQLGNVGYMLADLDPDDGIAPALSFMPAWWGQYNGMPQVQYFEYSRSGSLLVNDGGGKADLQGKPLRMEYGWNGASTEAALGARLDPLEQQLSLAMHLPLDERSRHASASVYADPIAFTLTPNTAVSFFSILDVEARLTEFSDSHFNVVARLELSIDRFMLSGPELWDQVHLQSSEFGFNLDERHYLFASYAHRDDDYVRGWAQLNLAAGSSTLAPIPEASHTAMLATGTFFMAGLGALRRRRSGKRCG